MLCGCVLLWPEAQGTNRSTWTVWHFRLVVCLTWTTRGDRKAQISQQFGEFSKGRPNAREGPGHPDELTYCEILLLDALIKVVFLSPRRCMQWRKHSLMRITKGCSKIGSVSCGHRSVINAHGNRTSRPSIARLGLTCVVAWTVSR